MADAGANWYTYSTTATAGQQTSAAMSNVETQMQTRFGGNTTQYEFYQAALLAEVAASTSGINGYVSPTYATTMAIDPRYRVNNIVPSDTVAFTLSNPVTAPPVGTEFSIRFLNSSGGTMGTPTFGSAFKVASFTKPANGTVRYYTFFYNGTTYEEMYRSGADLTP